jgi:hypothetical protein
MQLFRNRALLPTDDGERTYQETEAARITFEKRIATLQGSNKELSNKLAARGGGRGADGGIPRREAEKQVAEVRSYYQKKLKEARPAPTPPSALHQSSLADPTCVGRIERAER